MSDRETEVQFLTAVTTKWTLHLIWDVNMLGGLPGGVRSRAGFGGGRIYARVRVREPGGQSGVQAGRASKGKQAVYRTLPRGNME